MSAQSLSSLAAIRILPPPGIAWREFVIKFMKTRFHASARHYHFHPRREIQQNVDTLIVGGDGCVFAHSRKNFAKSAVFGDGSPPLRHPNEIGQQLPHSTSGLVDVASEPLSMVWGKIRFSQHFGADA